MSNALDKSAIERESLVFAAICDLSGQVRGKGFPAADLPSRLKKGVGIACSQIMISAFGPIYETPFGTQGDVILRLDPETRVHVEFPASAPESFYLGDLVTGEGEPWVNCPRNFLRRALADLRKESGLDLCAAFEQEFVFTGAEEHPAAYALDSFRRQGMFGETFVAALRRAGVTPDSFIAEFAPQQFEITSTPVIGIKAADQAVVTREIARAVAWRMGQRAIFAPIMEPEGMGNGTHIHFSLQDGDGKPAMYDPSRPCELSHIGARFVAGILYYLPALTAITASSVASYFRLTPDRWAPTWANLGYRDRGASVRVCPIFPSAQEEAARQFNVEYRVADAAASPYMALGALVHAGVEGIRKQMELPAAPPNFWAMSEQDRRSAGIARLPASLKEALDILESSQKVRCWFGDEFFAIYLQFKRSEINALNGLDPAEVCKRYVEVY